MPRPTTRSTRQQGPTITAFFSQSRVGDSVLPGKSLEENAPATRSRAKRALFSSSSVEVPIIEVQPVVKSIIPTKPKIAATQANSERKEKSEEKDTSPIVHSITSAPKNYGNSLMNEEVKKSRDVPLPSHYEDLYKAFNACETIVCLFDSSGKTLTFSALSQDVKKSTRKDFCFDRFSQILAVYPQAYDVKVKKITCVGERMGGVRSARWEHVIKPNLCDDLIPFVTDPSLLEETQSAECILTSSPRKNVVSPMKGRPITSSSGTRIPSSPCKPASPVKPLQREAVMDSRKRLKGWRKTCRQQVFRCLLARRVITAYDGFASERNLTLPATLPSLPIFFDKEFKAKLDSVCLPIEKAMLEQIPEEENAAGTSHQGMSEFLKIASDTVSTLTKGVEAALIELRSPQKKLLSSRGVPLSPAKFAEAPKQMSLLEKIKAKAALKAAAEKKRNPELEKKMADLVRLLDDRILFLIFEIYRSNSKTSIKLAEMENRLVASGKISQDKIPSILPRLTSLVPSHFSIGKTSIGEFIKVTDNSPNTSEIVESSLKKELEACKKDLAAHSSRAMRAIG